MKSNSSIQFSKAWWKKEAPEGLKKSAPVFEKALDEYAKANAGMRAGGDAAVKAFEKALEGLEAAAKQVIAEAKELEKKATDKAEKQDLSNTVDVMGKPFEREIDAARASIEVQQERAGASGDDDEEAGDNVFASEELYRAYLKRILPKLKKGAYSFAFGMPSTKPEEARFAFHRAKGGRQLGGQLKKAVGSKKFVFGVAGAEVAEAAGIADEVSARTLVLSLEGGKIPGLAKRAKVLLKLMGATAFNKVKVLVDGKEVESADENTPDTLDTVDLDAPDTEAPVQAPGGTAEPLAEPIPDAPPLPPQDGTANRVLTLKRRLAAINGAIGAMPETARPKLLEAARGALQRINANQLDAAETLIDALDARLAANPPAQPTPETPQAESSPEAEALRKALGPLVRRARALADQALGQRLQNLAQEVLSMLRAGQVQDATRTVQEIADALDDAEAQAVIDGAGNDPLVIWREAKEFTDSGLGQLQTALRGFGHPDLDRIAEFGLNGVTEGNQVALATALRNYNAAGTPEARQQAGQAIRAQVQQYRSFLSGSPILTLCEKNPFGVKVMIKTPLGKALDRIEQVVTG